MSFNFNTSNTFQPIYIVDEEVSFNFNTFNSKTEPIEFVDNEVSFNFTNQKLKQSHINQHYFVDWLKTMVIIYQDLLNFDQVVDIKSEPKDDYEETCCDPNQFRRRKKKRKRNGW